MVHGGTQICKSGGRATFVHIVKSEINSKSEVVESFLSALQKKSQYCFENILFGEIKCANVVW